MIEAIDNAWAHRQRNPGNDPVSVPDDIGIGVEQGAPFGDGVGGLKLWRECSIVG